MSGSEATERCGRCGEAVPAGAELCPSCGALQAAYRTPPPQASPTPEPVAPARAAPPPRRETVTAVPPLPLPSRAAERDPALDRARAELLATLHAPAQELAEAIAEREPEPAPVVAKSSVPATEAVVPAPPPMRPAAPPRPMTPRRVPARAQAAARPRPPGYVLRGTVEPVILTGVILLALSVCLVAMAAAASLRGLGVTGFVLGAVGIIAIVVALMVALVRHERERE